MLGYMYGLKLCPVNLGCDQSSEMSALPWALFRGEWKRSSCSSDDNMLTVFLCRLLQTLNTLSVLGDTAEAAALREKHVHGVTADGKLWIFLLVEYANELLSSEKYVKAVKPFTKDQRDAWER